MLVTDVMTSPAVTVHLDTPLRRVAHLLDDHAITTLPVVDGHNCLVGVISEADVLLDSVPPRWTHALGHPPGGESYVTRVADVMNFHPVTVEPGTDLTEVTRLMTGSSLRSLPVVEGGVVVGVVSRLDVLRVLARGDAEIAAEVGALLQGLEDDWLVAVEDGVVQASGPDDAHARDTVRSLATTVPGVVAVRFRSRALQGRASS